MHNEPAMLLQLSVSSYNAIFNHCSANMSNIKGNSGLTKKSRYSGMMRALRNCRYLSEVQDHHSTFTHRSQIRGKSRSQLQIKGSKLKGLTRSQLKRTTRNQLKGGHQESILFNFKRAIQNAQIKEQPGVSYIQLYS